MTTLISELPIDPGFSQVKENIKIETSEENIPFSNDLDKTKGMPTAIEQETMNKVVSGIQQASVTGSTKLPPRDIPTTTTHLTQDQQGNVNFVPKSDKEDFVKNYKTEQEMYNMNRRENNKQDSLDLVYEELQVPILIAFIFFLFKLPIFEKSLFKYTPFLFIKDGNMNFYGYIITSLLFATLYYSLSKILKHFSNI
tara:strand:+ start:453 stop:1043 length:591 start_codon:yes stop_codon:yes gene_type:complete